MHSQEHSQHYRYDTPMRRKELDQKYRDIHPITTRRHKNMATTTTTTTHIPEHMIRTDPSLRAVKIKPRRERVTTQPTTAKATTQSDGARFVTICLLGAIAMSCLLYAVTLGSMGIQQAYARYAFGQHPSTQLTSTYGPGKTTTTLLATIVQDNKLILIEIPEKTTAHTTMIAILDNGIDISDMKLDVQSGSDMKPIVTLTLVTGYDVWPTQQRTTQTYTLTQANDGYFHLN